MEEIPPNDMQRAKSTFTDILISANNDDIIIPMSATFDKAVLHIAIGNRSGIIIEKPIVNVVEEMRTSVKYATRKFPESRKEKKKENVTDIENEDKKYEGEPEEKLLRRDMKNGKENDGHLSHLVGPVGSQAHFETKEVTEMLEAGLVRLQAKSVNIKNDTDNINAILERLSTPNVKSFSFQEQDHKQKRTEHRKQDTVVKFQVDITPNRNTDIILSKPEKTLINTERAIPFNKQVFGTIVEAYQNENVRNCY